MIPVLYLGDQPAGVQPVTVTHSPLYEVVNAHILAGFEECQALLEVPLRTLTNLLHDRSELAGHLRLGAVNGTTTGSRPSHVLVELVTLGGAGPADHDLAGAILVLRTEGTDQSDRIALLVTGVLRWSVGEQRT